MRPKIRYRPGYGAGGKPLKRPKPPPPLTLTELFESTRRLAMFHELTGRIKKQKASAAELRRALRHFSFLYTDPHMAAVELNATLAAYHALFDAVKRQRPPDYSAPPKKKSRR